MNSNKFLLDTCFILGLYQGNCDAIDLMAGVSLNQCAVSIISEMELLGFANIDPDDEK